MWSDHKHLFVKLLVKLIILIIVFWAGVKFGELKTLVEYDYGPYMMHYWGSNFSGGSNGWQMGPWMMRGWYGSQSTTSANQY